jgi:hypothetical protein
MYARREMHHRLHAVQSGRPISGGPDVPDHVHGDTRIEVARICTISPAKCGTHLNAITRERRDQGAPDKSIRTGHEHSVHAYFADTAY